MVWYKGKTRNYENQCCELYTKSNTNNNSCKCQEIIEFIFFKVSSYTIPKNTKRTHAYHHERRIKFHIFCLLKYRHWHHIVYASKEKREWYEIFMVFSIKNNWEYTCNNNYRKYSSKLIDIECIGCNLVPKKSTCGDELPSKHPSSLKSSSCYRYDSWKIHIYS